MATASRAHVAASLSHNEKAVRCGLPMCQWSYITQRVTENAFCLQTCMLQRLRGLHLSRKASKHTARTSGREKRAHQSRSGQTSLGSRKFHTVSSSWVAVGLKAPERKPLALGSRDQEMHLHCELRAKTQPQSPAKITSPRSQTAGRGQQT